MGRTVKPTPQGGRQESNSLPRRLIQSHLLQTTLGTGAAQKGTAPKSPQPDTRDWDPRQTEPRAPQPSSGACHTDSLIHSYPGPLGASLLYLPP